MNLKKHTTYLERSGTHVVLFSAEFIASFVSGLDCAVRKVKAFSLTSNHNQTNTTNEKHQQEAADFSFFAQNSGASQIAGFLDCSFNRGASWALLEPVRC